MTDYSKLVEALRICADDSTGCGECPFVGKCVHAYYMDLKLAAADAIEALQEQVRMLDKHDTDLHNEGYDVGYYAGRRDWEPKRGEWIWDDKRCIYVCSVCGSPKVRENMDRQIIKEQAYCYSCGAKMEVQDGK